MPTERFYRTYYQNDQPTGKDVVLGESWYNSSNQEFKICTSKSPVTWTLARNRSSDVKSGMINIADNTPGVVTFTTAFATTPRIVAVWTGSIANAARSGMIKITGVSKNGFTIEQRTNNPNAADLFWIATDAGDS